MSTPAQIPPEPSLVGKPWGRTVQKRVEDWMRAVVANWALQLPPRHAKTHMTGGGDALPIDKLTSKGDLLTKTSLAYSRLGVGTNGQVLTADSTTDTGLKWAASTGSADDAVAFAFFMAD